MDLLKNSMKLFLTYLGNIYLIPIMKPLSEWSIVCITKKGRDNIDP